MAMIDNDASGALYSPLAADPELSDLVEHFVREVSDRITNLQKAAATKDWRMVGRLAHQIKGAAGSYGFDQVTPVAKRVEECATAAASEEAILEALANLSGICSRLRAGQPDDAVAAS